MKKIYCKDKNTNVFLKKDSFYIEVMLKERNIEVMIKYPKKSRLIKRIEMLDKLKETLRRI